MSKGGEIRKVVHALKKQGFDVQVLQNGHYGVTAPSGRRVQIAATPRTDRGVRNNIQRLKAIGFQP